MHAQIGQSLCPDKATQRIHLLNSVREASCNLSERKLEVLRRGHLPLHITGMELNLSCLPLPS
jgi:hypothetical protein